MKPLRTAKDGNDKGVIGLNCSDYVDTRILQANVPVTHNVPYGAKFVLFSSTRDFYVNFGGGAEIPVADVVNGLSSVLNPSLRALEGIDTIGLVSPEPCIVCMEFYA